MSANMSAEQQKMLAEMGHGGAVFVAGRGESNGGDRQRSELKSSKGVMINDRPMTGSRPGTGSKKKTKSELRNLYDQGDLPVKIENRGIGRKLTWNVDIENINFQQYLPIFFSGLVEKQDPYRFVAFEGIFELLETSTKTEKVLPNLPQIMKSVKTAMNTRDIHIVCSVLKVVQQLVLCKGVGIALQDYYRQFLPVCNIMKDKHLGAGGKPGVGDLVQETLEMLETYGGENALGKIQHSIPSYESCFSKPPENAPY